KEQVQAQFNGMPKIFSDSTTEGTISLLQNSVSPKPLPPSPHPLLPPYDSRHCYISRHCHIIAIFILSQHMVTESNLRIQSPFQRGSPEKRYPPRPNPKIQI